MTGSTSAEQVNVTGSSSAPLTRGELLETQIRPQMVSTEDYNDYNTLIEVLKSNLPLTPTQVTLMETVTKSMMKRNFEVEKARALTVQGLNCHLQLWMDCTLDALADLEPLRRPTLLVLDCFLR